MKRLIMLLLIVPLWVNAEGIYPFDSPKQEAQFKQLLTELRCLVCQNQDLIDSNAPLANDLKQSIYFRVKAGESDRDIVEFLTSRYGDFILFKPPMKPVTYFLWFGPFLFILAGLCFFYFRCLRR